MTAPRGAALDRVAAVAVELGDLTSRVVFIGGAIAPLLQSNPPFPRARITTDVDGVLASASYAETNRLQDELIGRGFRRDLVDPRHVHRFIAPNGIPFDLVPAGDHLGATGNQWDQLAIDTAVEATVGSVRIRHVAAAVFLAQKWAAHHDRGRGDPLASHDLEDILALLASRPQIVEELAAGPSELRAYVAEQAKAFLHSPDVEDLLAAHLNNAQDPVRVIDSVRAMLESMTH
jgi:hypothetical protein